MQRISMSTFVSVFSAALRSVFLAGLAVAFTLPALRAAIIPPDQLVAGKSQEEWLALSSKWLAEIPWDGTHPWQDRNGSHILHNQTGPVWHLPAANTIQPVTRYLSVPADKILLVGIGGASCSTLEAPPFFGGNEEQLRACAQSHTFESSCDVDGVPIPNLSSYIKTSPVFDVVLPPVNSWGVPGGGAGQSVAYAAGVMIQLSPGNHTIQLRARYPAADFSNNVTYVITAYQRPELAVRPLPAENLLELSWPAENGFSLQQANSPEPTAAWTPALVISSSVSGGTQFVTVAKEPGNLFFRLQKP